MMGEREVENTGVISFEVLQDKLKVNKSSGQWGERLKQTKNYFYLTHSKYSINSTAIHFCFY